jgi:hypothetical protein
VAYAPVEREAICRSALAETTPVKIGLRREASDIDLLVPSITPLPAIWHWLATAPESETSPLLSDRVQPAVRGGCIRV